MRTAPFRAQIRVLPRWVPCNERQESWCWSQLSKPKEDHRITKSTSSIGAIRVQYGALPYRLDKSGELEVLLLTSRSRGRWIIPKGWPIKALTPAKSAAREAFEEGGVRGVVGKKPLGRFIYTKMLNEDGKPVTCEVTVFPLAVTRQLKSWPEIDQRETRWVAARDAAMLADEEGLKPLLEAFAVKMAPKLKRAAKKAQDGCMTNREARRRARLFTCPR